MATSGAVMAGRRRSEAGDVPTGIAAHVELEEARGARFDRDGPRPWQVVTVAMRLHRAGIIDREQFAWCERYARACEMAPWRVSRLDGAGGADGSSGVTPTERQLRAAAFVRAAHNAAGKDAKLLYAAVVKGYRLADLAILGGWRPKDHETTARFTARTWQRVQTRLAGVIERCAGGMP